MTVDDYLDAAPEPQQSTLRAVRAILQDVLPEAEEGLSYGVPAFMVHGTPVAGYAYFKKHCGFYPHSGSVLDQLAEELTGYEWSKGTLKYPIDQPLPKDLVRRIVEVRLGQLDTG